MIVALLLAVILFCWRALCLIGRYDLDDLWTFEVRLGWVGFGYCEEDDGLGIALGFIAAALYRC